MLVQSPELLTYYQRFFLQTFVLTTEEQTVKEPEMMITS